MKNVFVTIVQKTFGTDRFEMTESFCCGFDPHLALPVRLPGIATGWSAERIEVRVRRAGFRLWHADRDRFDPVDRVLQNQSAGGDKLHCDFMR